MVATMACIANASTSEQLAFITGEARMHPDDMSPELWASLLTAGLKLLPLEELTEQMRSLRQILGQRHASEVPRTMTTPSKIIPALRSVGLGNVHRFLACTENKLMPSDWERAPRKQSPLEALALGDTELADIEDSILVVPVVGDGHMPFLRVDTIWTPVENWLGWGACDLSSTPNEFWYELSTITAVELDDAGLAEFAARRHSEHLTMGARVLWKFVTIMSQHQESIESVLRHTEAITDTLKGMAKRTGLPV